MSVLVKTLEMGDEEVQFIGALFASALAVEDPFGVFVEFSGEADEGVRSGGLDFAVFPLAHAFLGYSHGFCELGLGQAEFLPRFLDSFADTSHALTVSVGNPRMIGVECPIKVGPILFLS